MAAFNERFTPSGVRLRLRSHRDGELNWLFLPGGPGIGSESLHQIVDAVALPGTTWLVDLPSDGSNTGIAVRSPAGRRSSSKPPRRSSGPCSSDTHFPWIEQPTGVGDTFSRFTERMLSR